MPKKIPDILKLRMHWSKKEKDFVISYPSKYDGHFLHNLIGSKVFTLGENNNRKNYRYYSSIPNSSLALLQLDYLKELEDRGYDTKTLKFEITIKKSELFKKFPHLLNELSKEQIENLKEQGFSVD